MGYSIDFRRKVLEIKDRDRLSFEETAIRFGISKSSVGRWAKRLEPCRTRNKPATKIDMERLVHDVETHPNSHTEAERNQIYAVKQAGHQKSATALQLGRHKSATGRELQRDCGVLGYQSKQAQ